MRYAVAASAILGAVAAAPQMINIEAALAVPTPTILGPELAATKPAPVSYNPTVAASVVAAIVKEDGVVEKRDVDVSACGAKQPGGLSPVPGTSGTVDEYKADNSILRQNAQAAQPPTGYTENFKDLFGSSQQIGYLTYKNIETGSYDVKACADFCNSEKFCLGFNIYYERDPSYDPKTGCTNPPPITNLKCSLYGYNVAGAAATNTGQWRNQFQVIIVGSNGYTKTEKLAPTVKDFQAPANLPAAINAPNEADSYNGMRLFNNNPFDPSLCGAACEAQTQFKKDHPEGNFKPCNFFTSYILTKNEVPLGTYCALYTQTWDSTYAVNTGYYDGNDAYKVRNAAGYTIIAPTAV